MLRLLRGVAIKALPCRALASFLNGRLAMPQSEWCEGALYRKNEMFGLFESKEQQAIKWHQRGIEAFKRRDIDTATECLCKARELNPLHPGVLHDLGVITGQFCHDWPTAKRYLELALKIDPEFSRAWKSLAIVEKQLGNTDRAVELFRMIIDKYGWNPYKDPSVKESEREWLAENNII